MCGLYSWPMGPVLGFLCAWLLLRLSNTLKNNSCGLFYPWGNWGSARCSQALIIGEMSLTSEEQEEIHRVTPYLNCFPWFPGLLSCHFRLSGFGLAILMTTGSTHLEKNDGVFQDEGEGWWGSRPCDRCRKLQMPQDCGGEVLVPG